jgi:DNA-binding Lrp family transcriptional regulator
MEKKELLILNQFRKNARENLTTTARKTGIPVSTIYERLKKYEGNLIKKHTVLLDFGMLGFSLKVVMAIKIVGTQRDDFTDFLSTHHRVNSLYKITSGYDVMVEAIFKDLYEYQKFCDALEQYQILNKQEFFILEDVKQEDFLANDAFLDILETQLGAR